jgi:hypothetical protein
LVPRFLCDEMLHGLGRWLRAAGYDTVIAESGIPPNPCPRAADRRRAEAGESFSLAQLRPPRRRRLSLLPGRSWDRTTSSIW